MKFSTKSRYALRLMASDVYKRQMRRAPPSA